MLEATRFSASGVCGEDDCTAGSSNHQLLSLRALETGLNEVPGYASWRLLDSGPQVSIDERYAALPALTKRELRAGPPGLFTPRKKNVQAGLAGGEVELAKTSGCTDDQVTLVFSAAWWEASERAAWQLNEQARRVATGTHREAVLASPRCVGPGYTPRPLSMRERTIGRHLYLNQKINPAGWTTREVRRMADELNRWSPVVLEGDPAYLAVFARSAAKLGIELFQPQLIFLTYSFPSRVYLRQIRRAFGAPIASSYGSTETGHVFMECEAGRLHQNTEHCRVDFQPWLGRHGGPHRGRMLVTVFRNPWFSVLHFDIGDVARLDDRGPCPCGRADGLTLASIDGRIIDVTFAPDGRAVTVDDIDAALAEVEDLNGWQLDLPRPKALRLRVLTDRAKTKQVCSRTREIVASIYGRGIKIEVAVDGALQHEPSGKFRFARAAFPVDHSVLWKAE
jgi:phenylacetate-CoA ligase